MNHQVDIHKPPHVRATMPEASAIAIGQRLIMDGQQTFTVLRVDPCRRRDGSIRTMITWSAPCADCGETFYGASVAGGGMPTRRCFAHRFAGRPVMGGVKRRRVTAEWLPPEKEAGAEDKPATGPTSA